MTKREALTEFKRRHEADGRVDRVARADAWNNWTDSLCKEGRISRHQDRTWTNPY